MNATATLASAKPPQGRARRLLVRLNMTMFYCLGAAVLLESAAAARAARNGTKVDLAWLQDKQERARLLREHAASVWPEFGWETACAAMMTMPGMLHAQAGDLVATSVASHELAMFYRALAHIAEDAALRRDLESFAAAEDSRCAGMADAATRGALAAVRRARFIRGHVDHARNRVRCAFDVLQQQWSDALPFPAIDYECFLARARALLVPHLQLDWSRRVLYRGWLTQGRPLAKAAPEAAGQTLGARTTNAARSAGYGLPRAAVLR